MADHDKIAALILAKHAPAAVKDDGGAAGEDDGEEEQKEAAAEELEAAIKDGDKKAIVEAFQALHDLCCDAHGNDGDDGEG